MDIALLIIRLILSAVFGVAGVAKLYDREGSRQSFSDFGVPALLVPPLVWIVPIAEILTAIALVPLASAWVGALAGLVLLTVFSIGIARNLARGEAADCHCFGKLQSGPIGWPTLARNILLTVMAGIAVVGGWNGFSISALAWTEELRTADMVAISLSIAAFGLLATTFIYVRRISLELRSALEQISAVKKIVDEDYAEAQPSERDGLKAPKAGLPVGAPAPSFVLENVDGQFVSLEDLLAYQKPVMLLFVSPTCVTCTGVLGAVKEWQLNYRDELTFAVLSRGTRDETRERLEKFRITNLLLQGEPSIGDRFRAKWSPAGVLISARGKIASSVANGEVEIRELVANAGVSADAFVSVNGRHNGARTSSLSIGQLAPEFSAPDLSGNLVTSSDLKGRDTLLMFWTPDCSWCMKLLEDVSRWEANPPNRAPTLTIIASASIEEVKPAVKDVKSMVLIDPESGIADSFEATLTPSGIVIDSEGRIASGLAVGSKDVLALAGIERVKPLAESVV